jgi:hypothetical protein
MQQIRQHLTTTKLAATLALFLALGGAAAWAASSSGGKAIRACYKHHGGALRIAGRCRHGESHLTWNQVGPVGATGAKGSAGKPGKEGKEGKQGPKGETGPSDAYATGLPEGSVSAVRSSISKLTVPAGSYLIEAKTTFDPETTKGTLNTLTCALAPEPSSATRWDTGVATGELKNETVLSLIGAKTFGSTQTIELVCEASSAGKLKNARLVALKVGMLHGETP